MPTGTSDTVIRAKILARSDAPMLIDPQLLAVFFLHLPEMSRVCDENPDESPHMPVHPFIPGYSDACFARQSGPPTETAEKI
jgi:hypothetical protein